ncbi:MAG: hypothetical protein O3B13_05860 [Planctomycetota bacterium]|nr:hypothetical protein [Planctomycetota bacterium]MDA1162605.1 hypothetical protein [Planctomycetota bacterium]
MKAVVLTFDRLPAHLLGCYGNEWIETPGFDRLAASGSVFDQHFAELPGPVGPNHPWWTGEFEFFAARPIDHSTEEGSSISWLKILADRGVKCRLLAEQLEGLPIGLFYSAEEVGGSDGLNVDHHDVPIARLVQRGIELLAGDKDDAASSGVSDSSSELLWLHSRGVPSPWLPPRLFAELYLDELEEVLAEESGGEIASSLVSQFETDPDLVRLLLSDWQLDSDQEEGEPVPKFDEPTDDPSSQPSPEAQSEFQLDEVESPELELQISKLVFAGYVSLIDQWLQKLLAAVENSDERVLLVASANQGRSFGEGDDLMSEPVSPSFRTSDGTVRPSAIRRSHSLCDTELRTPLMMAEFSPNAGDHQFGSRHSALVQPVDLAATLSHWFRSDATGVPEITLETTSDLAGVSLLAALLGGSPQGHQATFHLGPDGQAGVRNRNWTLITSDLNELDDAAVRLFAKPDDQWDVHNVSSQYPDDVIAMLDVLQKRRHSR